MCLTTYFHGQYKSHSLKKVNNKYTLEIIFEDEESKVEIRYEFITDKLHPKSIQTIPELSEKEILVCFPQGILEEYDYTQPEYIYGDEFKLGTVTYSKNKCEARA